MCALIFFLLTGDAIFYYAIYILFTYFASFLGCEDDIFFKDPNLADFFFKLAENILKKLNSAEFMELVFFQV